MQCPYSPIALTSDDTRAKVTLLGQDNANYGTLVVENTCLLHTGNLEVGWQQIGITHTIVTIKNRQQIGKSDM